MLVAAVTAEAQQALLVGPAVAQVAVEQQVVAERRTEQQAAGGEIGLGVLVTLGADQAGHQEVLLPFVLDAQGHLRQTVVDQVAEQAHLEAEDVLAEAVVRQVQIAGQGAQVETLAGVGQLDAIAVGHGQAADVQAVVAGLHPRQEAGGAPLALLAIAGQHRPGHDAAAGRTVDAGGTAGGQQAPLLGAGQGRQQAAEKKDQACAHAQNTFASWEPCHCRSHCSKAAAGIGLPIR